MRWIWTRRVLAVIVLGWMAALSGFIGCERQPAETPPGAPRHTAARPASPVAVGTQVGNLAPEIEGQDVDGQTFRLSDYRGRVVVLDFWGDW